MLDMFEKLCCVQIYVINSMNILLIKLTSNDNCGQSTILPNQLSIAFTNARRERNAIRLAAMLATRLIDCEAPAAAASIKFCSVLKQKKYFRFCNHVRAALWLSIYTNTC